MIGVSIALATRRHAAHGGDHGRRRRPAVLDLSRSKRCCSARPWPPPTPPRCSPSCADRRCGGGWRARSRASPASTTRSPILLVLGCIEAIQHADYGLLDALWLAVSELAIGAAVGLAIGGSRRAGSCARHAALGRPVPGGLGRASPGIAFGGAQTLHGSGFLAAFLAGLVIGSASSPARRTIVTFHEGLAWVAQLALFLLLGLLVSRRADRDHPRGHRDRHRHRGDRAAARRADRRLRLHAAGAADARLGRAARRDADRVRDVPRDRGHPERPTRSSRSRSSSCCSRRSCRG